MMMVTGCMDMDMMVSADEWLQQETRHIGLEQAVAIGGHCRHHPTRKGNHQLVDYSMHRFLWTTASCCTLPESASLLCTLRGIKHIWHLACSEMRHPLLETTFFLCVDHYYKNDL
ncbi:hypothetical protein PVAP13_3KG400001 [Panicum virgatum]|uniref:Uncharacterized protein n=1 Tax=Panicum virgatum TaxID=38727 RepID=A0A8T0VB20_PANVG|nr:hypothetical protein PVAP13_3KG400001 [Panicum virgatum]